MTWLALADPLERRFSLRGIGSDRCETRRHPDDIKYTLARGTIIFETRLTADSQPHPLLSFAEDWPKQRSLAFQAIPGGGISVVQADSDSIAHSALQPTVAARTDTLRVTFSWDSPRGVGRFTVERPGDNHITSRMIKGIQPIPLQSLRRMFLGQGACCLSKDLVFAALSDCVEPVGPTPTLGPENMVLTPLGYKTAGSLRRGDTIICRGGVVVPVLQAYSRTVPARGSFAPVRLACPFFGLLEDVVVSSEQKLVIDGSDVEYLFNEAAVLVPVRHLINGSAAQKEPCGPVIEYVQMLLPAHEALTVAGTCLESLFVDNLKRDANLLNATIMQDTGPNSLPEHQQAAFKELKWYDAIQLARQRAA